MRNRADWLHELIQIPKIKTISRAHLPRLLDGLNWSALNELIERCFGVRIQSNETSQWVAIDGKALRGTLDAGEKQNLILAVVHDTREVVAQARQCGDKSSEIPVVRELLKDSGLEKQKVSLDGSSRQGCDSRRVKVPPPSVAQNGRLAYPLLGEVTDRDMRGRKSHGRPVY